MLQDALHHVDALCRQVVAWVHARTQTPALAMAALVAVLDER